MTRNLESAHELTLQDVIEQIKGLEKKTRNRFMTEVIVIPLLLAFLGFFFDNRLQSAKQNFDDRIHQAEEAIQRAELKTRQADTLRGIIPELFSDTPARALLAEEVVTP